MSALLPDEVWDEVEPLLPKHVPSPLGGAPRVDDRTALAGIIFVLKSGLPWQLFPQELGCSGSTCWRRFDEWTEAGVWPQLFEQLLNQLGKRGEIDLSCVVVDSASIRAAFRGAHTGPNPTDRSKRGVKRHVLTEAQGVPLVVQTGPANQRDEQRVEPLLDAVPPIQGPRGRPRRKPARLQGDAGYGFSWVFVALKRRGITPQLARRRENGAVVPHGSGLGRTRYVVERTLSWFGNFRRLKLCYERTHRLLQAFHELAACLICAKKLTRF